MEETTTRRTVNKGYLLAEYVKQRGYGEIIHYQDIEHITGEKRGTQRYYAAITKARKILEDCGHMMKSCGGGDYQIPYPGDYVTEATKMVDRAKTRMVRGKGIIDNAPVQDMTTEERIIHNRAKDFFAVQHARMTGAVVEVKTLIKPRSHPYATADGATARGA